MMNNKRYQNVISFLYLLFPLLSLKEEKRQHLYTFPYNFLDTFIIIDVVFKPVNLVLCRMGSLCWYSITKSIFIINTFLLFYPFKRKREREKKKKGWLLIICNQRLFIVIVIFIIKIAFDNLKKCKYFTF